MKTFIPKLNDPYWDELRKLYGVDNKEKYIAEQRKLHENKRKFKLAKP